MKNIKGKNENPTKYRSPSAYIELFLSKLIEKSGAQYGFELVFSRPNRAYINVSLIKLTNKFFSIYSNLLQMI